MTLHISTFEGSNALSSFRVQQLLPALHAINDKIASIAAASILAKTVRDAEMMVLHAQYPMYGFDRHMGYPTAAHFAALETHGASPVHRRSFGPVARQLSLL